MFRNVLLPLDGSHFSELALPAAARIANAAGATLHIVRVHVAIPPQADANAHWDIDEQVRDKERGYLNTAAARARITGVTATCELLQGPVVPALESYIEATGIDLVVMTTHGRSGLSRAVLGSVAERCVRTTHVPVLLLNPRAADDETPPTGSIKRVLVALDGSPESEEALAPALDLALLSGAHVTITRIATAPFDIAATLGAEALAEYMRRAREQAQHYLDQVVDRLPPGVALDAVALSADRPAVGILRCRDDVNADLIVMATSGRSGWARIAIGSVAESVLFKATVPVMMLRPSAFDGRARKESGEFASANH